MSAGMSWEAVVRGVPVVPVMAVFPAGDEAEVELPTYPVPGDLVYVRSGWYLVIGRQVSAEGVWVRLAVPPGA